MSEASAARRPPTGLLAVSAFAALLVLTPIGLTILRAARIGSHDTARLLFRPLVGELLVNTLMLVGAATLSAALVGTAIAWFVERTHLPGRRVWAVLAAVPLAIPAFITSYAWVSLSPDLQDFAGALLVVTCAYYPLVYLPVAASLRGMDPALEETARALGSNAFGCFVRVVLPQLRPALLGGMLLVILNVLTEFGAFALLRYRTFTTEIYAEYQASFDGTASALLSCVLIFLCLVCLIAEFKVRGQARYARIGLGARRSIVRYNLGATRWPLVGAFAILTIVTIGVPIGMTLYWLTQPGVAAVTPAEVSPALLAQAATNSIGLGLAGAATAMLLALPIGLMATRYRGASVTLIERASYLTQGVPGIVIALALVFLTVHYLHPFYQSASLLVLAYAIQFLSFAVVGVRAALAHVQPSLERTARSLGLGWAAAGWRVTLPLAGPGLGAAAAMVFVSVVTELTATLLLAPIGTQTLATQIWVDTSTLAFAAAAPYTALMLTISLISTWLLARRFGRSAIGGHRQDL